MAGAGSSQWLFTPNPMLTIPAAYGPDVPDPDAVDDDLALVRQSLAALHAGFRPLENVIADIGTENRFLPTFYLRTLMTFEAIERLLSDVRYGPEAMILARPLFEDSLRLGYLSTKPAETRSALLLTYIHKGLIETVHDIDDFERRKYFPPDSQNRDLVKLIDDGILDFMHKHKLRSQTFPKVDDMAFKLKRSFDRVAYATSHDFVHGGSLALASPAEPDHDSGVLLLSSRFRGVNIRPVVSVWASRSALLGVRCCC